MSSESDVDSTSDKTGRCLRNVANMSHVKPTMMLDTNVFNPKYLQLVIPKAAPKVAKMFDKIAELDAKDMRKYKKHFKHMIFTGVASSNYGAKLVASAFVANGFTPVFTRGLGLKSDEYLAKTPGQNFGLLLSKNFGKKSMSVKFRKAQMLKYNERPTNVQGELMRFIILDHGFLEGIDLFDVKYVHLFEPLVSHADQKQAIGRSTRFCGQKGLEFHPRSGWPLFVFRYDVAIPKMLQNANPALAYETLFELYLEHSNIDMKRVVFAAELEEAVIDASVDKLLTKEVHTFKIDYVASPSPSPRPSPSQLQVAGARKDMQAPRSILGKTAMQTYVASNFAMFKYPKVKLENKCVGSGGKVPVTFTPTQDFVRHFFQPASAYKGLLLFHSVGTGKCHAKDTPILMYNGTVKKVQDVIVGDALMGDDSTPRQVISLAQGTDEMYDIVPSKGDKYTVNYEHVLVLEDPNGKLVEIEVKDYLKLPLSSQNKLKGIRRGVDFKEKELPIDPYFLGVCLSADSFTTTDCNISYDFMKTKAEQYGLTIVKDQGDDYMIRGGATYDRIPLEYLANSRENRVRLLTGILDAVGYFDKEIDGFIVEPKKEYSEGILFLARSLGFAAYTNSYTISILGIRGKRSGVLSNEITVNHVGQGEYFGFTLDGNNRYLLGDFTVTHNTCTAIATASTTFEREGYSILWVTRHTLKSDIWKNMYDQICSVDIQERIDKGKLVLPKGNPVPNPKKYVSDKWIEPISYKQFSNMLLKQNRFYEEIVTRNGSVDPLRKTLIIIDEAHKLYAENVAASEKPKVEILEQMIQNSYKVSGKHSCRILLMTATPYTSDGMEMINLLNLLRPRADRFPKDFEKFGKAYLKPDGTFTKVGLTKFQNEVSGYVSYLNRSQDARNFAHPIIENILVPLTVSTDQHVVAARHVDNEVKVIALRIKELRDEIRSEKIEVRNKKGSDKERVNGCKAAAKSACASAILVAKSKKDDAYEACAMATNKAVCKRIANGIYKDEVADHKARLAEKVAKCKDKSPNGVRLANKIAELNELMNKTKGEKNAKRGEIQLFVAGNKEKITELKGLKFEKKALQVQVKALVTQLKKLRASGKKASPSKKATFKSEIKALNLKIKEEKAPLIDLKEQIMNLTLDKKISRIEIGRGAMGDMSQEKALGRCF